MQIARLLRHTRNILIVACTAAIVLGLVYVFELKTLSHTSASATRPKEWRSVVRRALAFSGLMSPARPQLCPSRYVVLVGPNGAGKTTIISKLLKEDAGLKPAKRFYTRTPRQGETNSSTHHFLSEQEFDVKAAQGQMIISDVHFAGQQVAGALVPMRSGVDIGAIRAAPEQRFIFDFHAKHAMLWKATKHDVHSVVICIVPPSREILESRLTGRHQGEPHIVKAYMQNVKTELAIMERENMCQYRVVNTDMATTMSEMRRIVQTPMAC